MRGQTGWLGALAACVALLAGCGDSDIPPRPYGCVQLLTGACVSAREVNTVQDERDVGYPVYWVGQEINGLKFSSLSSTGQSAPQGRGVTFDYGVCKIGFGDEGCGIPLTITTSPYCEVPFPFEGQGWRESTFRGAKRYDSPHKALLVTGPVVVVIQATDPANTGLAARALTRLRAESESPSDGLLAYPEKVDCAGVSSTE